MGTCISRCASSSQEELENVQDKLVISQTPLPTIHPSKEISLKQTTPSFPASKEIFPKQTTPISPPSKEISPKQTTPSSLSTTPTTRATSSCITTTSASTLSSSSSSSISNDGPHDSGEISRAHLKKNARSSPTDPIKGRSTPKNPRRFQKPNTKEQPPELNVAAPKQPSPRRCAHSQSPRKARSSSPSLARPRSTRKDTKKHSVSHSRQNLGSRAQDPQKENPKNGATSRSRSPFSSHRFSGRDLCNNPTKGLLEDVSKLNTVRRGHYPSPRRRFNADAHYSPLKHRPEKNYNPKKGDAGNVALRGVAKMKENTRPGSPSSSWNHGFCSEKRVVGNHQNRNPQGDHHTHGEATPKLEDPNALCLPVEGEVDNPLISLDCFIFL